MVALQLLIKFQVCRRVYLRDAGGTGTDLIFNSCNCHPHIHATCKVTFTLLQNTWLHTPHSLHNLDLRGSTRCAFRDALPRTSVVMSGYLSYWSPSISSNQSGHFPLTSAINKALSPKELPLTGYFLIFGSFSVNGRDSRA